MINLLGTKNDYFKFVRDYKFRKYRHGQSFDIETQEIFEKL